MWWKIAEEAAKDMNAITGWVGNIITGKKMENAEKDQIMRDYRDAKEDMQYEYAKSLQQYRDQQYLGDAARQRNLKGTADKMKTTDEAMRQKQGGYQQKQANQMAADTIGDTNYNAKSLVKDINRWGV